ncbi:hypothetical protein ACIQVL_42445 [Streptomyces sp. NPDC090499]|uniref:hypothetical protein n=1 Tax=unclassified Streptomyces TaxID=2593676 RepID=UPI003801C22D
MPEPLGRRRRARGAGLPGPDLAGFGGGRLHFTGGLAPALSLVGCPRQKALTARARPAST